MNPNITLPITVSCLVASIALLDLPLFLVITLISSIFLSQFLYADSFDLKFQSSISNPLIDILNINDPHLTNKLLLCLLSILITGFGSLLLVDGITPLGVAVDKSHQNKSLKALIQILIAYSLISTDIFSSFFLPTHNDYKVDSHTLIDSFKSTLFLIGLSFFSLNLVVCCSNYFNLFKSATLERLIPKFSLLIIGVLVLNLSLQFSPPLSIFKILSSKQTTSAGNHP